MGTKVSFMNFKDERNRRGGMEKLIKYFSSL